MWVYRKINDSTGAPSMRFEIGFFIPMALAEDGRWCSKWECVRTYTDEGRAAMAVNYLNGSSSGAPAF